MRPYNGRWYRIGEGQKAFNPDKTADEDFYILTLASIAAELRTKDITEANIYLAVGLPTTWTVRQRNAYHEYMMRNKDVEFVFNDIGYRLHFTQCSVFPQGYAAMVPMMDVDKQYNGFQKFMGTVMMADIGNGTMNIMRLEDGRPLDQYCWTEVLGVHQCALTIRKQMMDKDGLDLPEDVIEQFLRTGKPPYSGYELGQTEAVDISTLSSEGLKLGWSCQNAVKFQYKILVLSEVPSGNNQESAAEIVYTGTVANAGMMITSDICLIKSYTGLCEKSCIFSISLYQTTPSYKAIKLF